MPIEYSFYYIYYIYYSFWGLPFVLRVSVFALIFFIPLYLLLGHIFLRYRGRYNNVKKTYQNFEIKYENTLCNILTSQKHLTTEDFNKILDSSIKKLKKRDKRILAKLLCTVCKKSDFINYENNQNLLEYLKIRQLLEKQLKHGNIILKQDSLRKLEDLNTRVSGAVLTSLTYSRNEFLRKRSRSSYLRFTLNDSFRFFDESFDKNLNNWDKIDLHYALEEKSKSGKLPNLIRWVLRCDSLAFRCFMIDEIAYFNQRENAQVLMQLVKEPETNSVLRKHCIDALGKMQYLEIEPELLNMYSSQPQYVQDSIIRVLGKFKTGNALFFLIKAYEECVDDEKKLFILSVIYNYGKEGKDKFETMKLNQNQSDFSLLSFAHVSNPLLSV